MSNDIIDQNALKNELQAILGRAERPPEAPPKKSKPVRPACEEVVVPFRCAVTGKAFLVTYRGKRGQKLFITRIDKVKTGRGDSKDTGSSEFTEIDIQRFSQTGWCCPWCRKAGEGYSFTFIRCGRCRELVCGGLSTAEPDGTDIFRCHDGCGKTGIIQGAISSLSSLKEHPPEKAPDSPAQHRGSVSARQAVSPLPHKSSVLRIGRKS